MSVVVKTTRWTQVLAVAFAAVVAVVPALSQGAVGAQLSLEERILLPEGEELPDAQLLQGEGEVDPLTVTAAMVVGAGIGAALDLFAQGVMIAAGWKTEVDLRRTGVAAGIGALTGPILAPKAAVTVVRSAMVDGARWTARAAQATGATAASLAYKAHEALHTVHVALHNHVRTTLGNVARSAWDWLLRSRREP